MKFTLFHCCARTGKSCTSKVKPMCWSEHQSYAAENAEDSWCASEGRFFFLPFVFLAVNVMQFFLSYICDLMGEKLNCYCPVNCFQSLADHFLPSLQTDSHIQTQENVSFSLESQNNYLVSDELAQLISNCVFPGQKQEQWQEDVEKEGVGSTAFVSVSKAMYQPVEIL